MSFGYSVLGFGSGGGAAPYQIEYLVIAGGARGSANTSSGGSGAGGYRNSYASESSGGGCSTETPLTVSPGTVYTITIGAGSTANWTNGDNSEISGSDITSVTCLGGGASGYSFGTPPKVGGCGGGGEDTAPQHIGAAGTSCQGYAGGNAPGGSGYQGGGGGGVGGVGGNGSGGSGGTAGAGGAGLSSSITGASVARGGGGGGGCFNGTFGTGTSGGGNGGRYSPFFSSTAGTANTGGGGGGSDPGSAGGSGVIILRMLDGNYSGTTTGSPTVATGVGGTDTVLTFTGSGSYTA